MSNVQPHIIYGAKAPSMKAGRRYVLLGFFLGDEDSRQTGHLTARTGFVADTKLSGGEARSTLR